MTEPEFWTAKGPSPAYFEKSQYGVFKSAFLSPGDNRAKASLLADGIRRYAGAEGYVDDEAMLNERDYGSRVRRIWSNMLEIAEWLPAEGSLHDVLVVALAILKSVDEDIGAPGTAPDKYTGKKLRWPDLPYFGYKCQDLDDPTTDDPEMVEDGGPWTDGENAEMARLYINQMSFLARVAGAGIYPLTMCGVWQLRCALEEPLPELEFTRECRLGAARQWVLHAGHRIFDYLRAVADADGQPARVERGGLWDCTWLPGQPALAARNVERLGKGSLCADDGDIGTYSLQRWGFWKDRLAQVRKEIDEEGSVAGWIDEMLDKMDRVEREAGPIEVWGHPKLEAVEVEVKDKVEAKDKKEALGAVHSPKEMPTKQAPAEAKGEKGTTEPGGRLGPAKQKLEMGCVVS